MNKNTKGVIVVGVVFALGYGYYYMTMSQYSYGRTISKVTKRIPSYYSVKNGWDAPYIKEWALAIRKKSPTFEYGGKTLDSNTGRVIQGK
tara:strand:+ start:2384 stop:2653 length:270 start_codon:yes stop_codon:yes gene_type:complete